jgi:uncharacterized surface protein with fasciclin (FAS1) repeats
MSLSKITLASATAALTLGAFGVAAAQVGMEDPMVGGAAMYASKNIVENAANSPDHTTLVTAIKVAGLVATLEGPGPFTVFAPTNEAFAKLPPGTVDSLLRPENNAQLIRILSYHAIAGRMTSGDIIAQIRRQNGRARLTTTIGEPLYATLNGGRIYLTDVHGGVSMVTIPDVYQSNGVIQVVNTVLMP